MLSSLVGSAFDFRRRIPGILSAAADLALAKPGLRTAAFLADRVPYWFGRGAVDQPTSGGPTVGLAVKVATDESFRTLMVAMSHAPTPNELRKILEEVQVARSLFEYRGWLDDPESYHRDPPPLEKPKSSKVSFYGSDYRHIQFESLYEPHPGEPGRQRWMGYEPVRTAHAWVLRHQGGPRPWLVCIHGFRMGWPMADFTAFRAAWLHGALGLNIAIPVLPLHGQRKVGGQSGDGFFSAQAMDTIHAEAQAIWDLRRLISWIRHQGSDDIGVYGVSLGGYTTALLAGFDPNLSCVIAGMPPICFADLLRLHAPAILTRSAEIVGVDWASVGNVLRVVSPLGVTPKVPFEKRYLFGGTADRVVPLEHMRQLSEHWGEPNALWYDGSHISFTWESTVREFVHRALHEGGLLWRRPKRSAAA